VINSFVPLHSGRHSWDAPGKKEFGKRIVEGIAIFANLREMLRRGEINPTENSQNAVKVSDQPALFHLHSGKDIAGMPLGKKLWKTDDWKVSQYSSLQILRRGEIKPNSNLPKCRAGLKRTDEVKGEFENTRGVASNLQPVASVQHTVSCHAAKMCDNEFISATSGHHNSATTTEN
jgi:hypothetical protein